MTDTGKAAPVQETPRRPRCERWTGRPPQSSTPRRPQAVRQTDDDPPAGVTLLACAITYVVFLLALFAWVLP